MRFPWLFTSVAISAIVALLVPGQAEAQAAETTTSRLELRRDPCSFMRSTRARGCREEGLVRRRLARTEIALGVVALSGVAFDGLAIGVVGSCWTDDCPGPPRGVYAGLGTGAALGFLGASALLVHGGVRVRRIRRGSSTMGVAVLPALALRSRDDAMPRAVDLHVATLGLRLVGTY